MEKEYSFIRKGTLWYPGNYTDSYYIRVDSENKSFVNFLDEKIAELIQEFQDIEKKGIE